MTDTPHKNPESCTESDTPETDAVLKQFEHHLPNWFASEIMAAVARKLERERNKAEERAKDLEEQVNIWKRSHSILVKSLDNWKQLAVAQEKQIIRLQENGPLIMVTDL